MKPPASAGNTADSSSGHTQRHVQKQATAATVCCYAPAVHCDLQGARHPAHKFTTITTLSLKTMQVLADTYSLPKRTACRRACPQASISPQLPAGAPETPLTGPARHWRLGHNEGRVAAQLVAARRLQHCEAGSLQLRRQLHMQQLQGCSRAAVHKQSHAGCSAVVVAAAALVRRVAVESCGAHACHSARLWQ